MTEHEADAAPVGPPAGAVCPGCGEEIQVGQTVLRLTAGLLLADARFDDLALRPDVYIHAGAGYDAGYNVTDRWCVTPEAIEAALRIMLVSDATSPSGH